MIRGVGYVLKLFFISCVSVDSSGSFLAIPCFGPWVESLFSGVGIFAPQPTEIFDRAAVSHKKRQLDDNRAAGARSGATPGDAPFGCFTGSLDPKGFPRWRRTGAAKDPPQPIARHNTEETQNKTPCGRVARGNFFSVLLTQNERNSPLRRAGDGAARHSKTEVCSATCKNCPQA
ncbi:MAG: hypothetical protein K2G93_07880, partial [Rikenella sp.]|nr:hypothetical protein [Rikenella sp.]